MSIDIHEKLHVRATYRAASYQLSDPTFYQIFQKIRVPHPAPITMIFTEKPKRRGLL